MKKIIIILFLSLSVVSLAAAQVVQIAPEQMKLQKMEPQTMEMSKEISLEEWTGYSKKVAAAGYDLVDYYVVEGMMYGGLTAEWGAYPYGFIMTPAYKDIVFENLYGPTTWTVGEETVEENSVTFEYGNSKPGLYSLPQTTDHMWQADEATSLSVKGYLYASTKQAQYFIPGANHLVASDGNIPLTQCAMYCDSLYNESGKDFYIVNAGSLGCPYAYGTDLVYNGMSLDTIISIVRNVSPMRIKQINMPIHSDATTMEQILPEGARVKVEILAADLTEGIIYTDSIYGSDIIDAADCQIVNNGYASLVAEFREEDMFGGLISVAVLCPGDFVVQITGYNESNCNFGFLSDYYAPTSSTLFVVNGQYTEFWKKGSNLAISYDAYWPGVAPVMDSEVLVAPVEGGIAMDGEYSAFAIYTNVYDLDVWMIDEEETSEWLELAAIDDSALESDGYVVAQIAAEALPADMTGRKGAFVIDVDGYKLSIPVQQGDDSKDKYSEEFISACDSYTWNGKTYTQSGTYTYTTIAADGNDSIVILHLTISPTLYTEETISACDSYVWNGHTYTEGGTYTYTTTSVTGCDSIVTLHLTISQSDVGETEYVTICHGETYTWNGLTYSTEGEYSITLSNTNGCDSIVTLQLTILPEMLTTEEYVAICYGETYTWNAQTYATAGSYTAALSSVFGCDSTAILHLTILPEAIRKTEYISAPTNKTVTWRGKEYNEIGIYYDTVHFVVNPMCDSVIYMLDLTIADNIDSDKYCGDNLTWYYSNGALIITGSGAMYDEPDRLSYRDESWYPARVNNIVLPDAITHISSVAFADCSNLTNIVIPNRVTSIGDGAFSWTGLQSVTIPASVTELGEQVFEACNNLHTIIYEGYPTVISNQAIHPLIGCVHLDTVIAPAALWHCTNADEALENRYGVPHKARYIEVTDGLLTNQAVKYIAQNATALEVLDLTNTTNTTLPYGALYNSYQLTQLYLPAYIETLPESMIEGGNRLMEITIPATVTEIGNYAFAGCVNIWRMTVEATTPPKVYENTFDGVNRSISVLVPAGSEQAYREAEYWREFFIDNTNSPLPISNCQKILRENHILILREGRMYTIMGAEVK